MDRENDNSPGGSDKPHATPPEGVVAPVVPPAPTEVAAQKDVAETLDAADAAPRMRDLCPANDLSLPLPLVPSRYGLEERAPERPPMLRPSVAATLPPRQVDVLPPPAPALRVTPDSAPVVDLSRLTLAPEAHAVRGSGISFGRDPAFVAPPQAPNPAVDLAPAAPIISPILPSPAFARSGTDVPITSVPAVPLRIEPVFAPSATNFNRDAFAVAPEALVPSAPPKPASHYLKTAAKFAVYAAAAWLGLIAFLILAYRFVNPPMSSLMLQQWLTGQSIARSWVDIESISPQVVRAVLLSEDGRFCEHRGVDFDAMQDAIERAADGTPRGASTISMQVTKNLFLWPSKSYVRKAIEIPLTWAMELVWPKWRIMEIYLNIAEWGPGIFGVEAASQFHFQKSARRLNEREAAQLAVALPNPYMRDAGDPGPKTRRLASDIQGRMRNAYPSQTACVLTAGAAGR